VVVDRGAQELTGLEPLSVIWTHDPGNRTKPATEKALGEISERSELTVSYLGGDVVNNRYLLLSCSRLFLSLRHWRIALGL